MRQLFKVWKRLLAALIVGFSLTSASAAISNGYYYIKTGSSNAMINEARFLGWDTFKSGNMAMMFYIENISGDEYYLQSLDDGNWFSNQNAGYITEMRGIEDRASITFEPKGTGYKIRPTAPRADYPNGVDKRNSQHKYTDYGNFTCDGVHNILNGSSWKDTTYTTSGEINKVTTKYSGDAFPQRSLGQWTGATWTVEAVPEAELNLAQLKVNLRRALDVYNQARDYTVGSALITDSTQFSAVSQQPESYSSFANLIDGNLGTCYQATWDNSKWAVANGPQWLQVDLGEGNAQSDLELQFGLRNNFWGTVEQWRDVTIYATNDATAATATENTTMADLASNTAWTRVSDLLLTEGMAVDRTSRKPMASKNDITDYYQNYWKLLQHWDVAQHTSNRYIIKNFSLTQPYRYLRFYVNTTVSRFSGNMEFTIGDFQLYGTSGASNATDVSTLASQIDAANTALRAGSATADLVSSLKTAADAVLQNISERAALANLVDSINNAHTQFYTGLSNYQTRQETFNAALAAAKAGAHNSSADYATLAKNLRKAFYNGMLGYPEDGHFYVLRNIGTSANAACYKYDASRSGSDWRLSHFAYTTPTSITDDDKPYIFQFKKAEGTGMYYIKNISNQKYVGRARNANGSFRGAGEGLGFVNYTYPMHVRYETYPNVFFTINNDSIYTQDASASNAYRYSAPIGTQGNNWLGCWTYYTDAARWYLEEVDSTEAVSIQSAMLPNGDGYYYIVTDKNSQRYGGEGLYTDPNGTYTPDKGETTKRPFRVYHMACSQSQTPERTDAKFIFKATRTANGHTVFKNIVNQKSMGWNGIGKDQGAGLAYVKGDYVLVADTISNGIYNIWIDNAGKLPGGNLIESQYPNVAGYWIPKTPDGTNNYNFVSVNATDLEANLQKVTIGETGYASCIFGFDAIAPEGVTAYTVNKQDDDGGVYLTKVEGTIPAYTPIFVGGTAGTYTFTVDNDNTPDALTGNLLKGSVTESTATDDASTTYYALTASSEDATKPVIKKVRSGVTIPAGKAYLIVAGSAAGSPALLNIHFDDATGINSAISGTEKNEPVYDLQGRRVVKPTKGIYIQNGKKVILK